MSVYGRATFYGGGEDAWSAASPGNDVGFVDLGQRVPRNHPLRVIRQFADRALAELSPVFDRCTPLVADRPSPPERLLKASLLISLYSVRSERAFCEELDYQLLFRRFLDMGLMEPSFDPTVFTKNRRRLLNLLASCSLRRCSLSSSYDR